MHCPCLQLPEQQSASDEPGLSRWTSLCRVEAPFHEKALREWTRLELDPKTGKVDHGPGGSKDLSDAMTGVASGLTMMSEVWLQFEVPVSELPTSVVEQVARENNGEDEEDE